MTKNVVKRLKYIIKYYSSSQKKKKEIGFVRK